MKKLWEKNKEKMNYLVETFETKGDLLLDQKLIPYDIQGSLAHAQMLFHIGLLTKKEYEILKGGLEKVLELYKKGGFQLVFGDEDMHTKIENYLTTTYGNVGKKIHTARSRNDQILTALRLYSKDSLQKTISETKKLKKSFEGFSKKYKNISLPGYTHMQKAMPSSIDLWAKSFVEAFTDDISVLQSTHKLIDQSPLGSAAGYGLPITIDRAYSAKQLGFAKVQNNPLYCQNSKGKFDASILSSLMSIQMDINKFASDVLLFTTSEFNFFEVSQSLCSGSSIMPQKKNVDIAELLR
nr:argininosuccinate lyase [Candidatus Levybacteria bacterium]